MPASIRDAQRAAALALAFRYGVDLPKPPKLKLAAPGFTVGACSTLRFSPDGEHLLVATSNGCFLWDTATGTRRCRLNAISNPCEFVYSDDSAELLMRNDQSRFARIATASGEPIAKFKADHPLRMDGAGCFGPGRSCVLQLAYEGLLLILDPTDGRVLDRLQLDRNGYSGQVHWRAAANEAIVAQTGTHGTPSALWRLRWPFDRHPPERMPGRWTALHTAFRPRHDQLLLHHVVDGRAQLDVIDLSSSQRIRQIACGNAIIPDPSLSHDGRAWATRGEHGIEIDIDEQRLVLPVASASAQFHPTADLVAVAGEAGFVAPRSALPALVPALQTLRDRQQLELRGYARQTDLPGRALPPRYLVYAGPAGFLLQPERIDGRHYRALACTHALPADVEPHAAADALATALAQCGAAAAAEAPRSTDERRQLHGSRLRAPSTDWTECIAVSTAGDAIELWQMKRRQDGAFEHTSYPVAALPPDTSLAVVWQAIRRTLR